MSDNLPRQITVEIRHRRGRHEPTKAIHTGEVDAVDDETESPTAKPRTSTLMLKYDTLTSMDKEIGLLTQAIVPPITNPSDEVEVEHKRTKQSTIDCNNLAEDLPSGRLDGDDINTHNGTPTLPCLHKRNMLDPTYSYNPYPDYDEYNEAHYRYDQSVLGITRTPTGRVLGDTGSLYRRQL